MGNKRNAKSELKEKIRIGIKNENENENRNSKMQAVAANKAVFNEWCNKNQTICLAKKLNKFGGMFGIYGFTGHI